MMFAAYAFAALAAVVALFQVALALGAPWGHLTWGGKHPGQLPAAMRVVAAASAAVLAMFAMIVLARSGIILPQWEATSRWLIWIVTGYSALGVLANAVTPSRAERHLWLPVAIAMFITSLIVAL